MKTKLLILTIIILLLSVNPVYGESSDQNSPIIKSTSPKNNSTGFIIIPSYQLQQATDPRFVNIVTNITDINYVNFPNYFSGNEKHVSFELPKEYRSTEFDQYYFRVRGFKKQLIPTLEVIVDEPQNQLFTITWSSNASGKWDIIDTKPNLDDGHYFTAANFSSKSNTTYWWRLCINDSDGNWNNKTYRFTTSEIHDWGEWSPWWTLTYVKKIDTITNLTIAPIRDNLILGFDLKIKNYSEPIKIKLNNRDRFFAFEADSNEFYPVNDLKLSRIDGFMYPFEKENNSVILSPSLKYHIFDFSGFHKTIYESGWEVEIKGKGNHLYFHIVRSEDKILTYFTILTLAAIIAIMFIYHYFFKKKCNKNSGSIIIFIVGTITALFFTRSYTYIPLKSLVYVIIGIELLIIILFLLFWNYILHKIEEKDIKKSEPQYMTKQWLIYQLDKKSEIEIAKEYLISESTIKFYKQKYNINKESEK